MTERHGGSDKEPEGSVASFEAERTRQHEPGVGHVLPRTNMRKLKTVRRRVKHETVEKQRYCRQARRDAGRRHSPFADGERRGARLEQQNRGSDATQQQREAGIHCQEVDHDEEQASRNVRGDCQRQTVTDQQQGGHWSMRQVRSHEVRLGGRVGEKDERDDDVPRPQRAADAFHQPEARGRGQHEKDCGCGGVSPGVPPGRGIEGGVDQVADTLTLWSVLPAEQRPCIRAVEESLKEVPLVPEEDVDRVAVYEHGQAQCQQYEHKAENPGSPSRADPIESGTQTMPWEGGVQVVGGYSR